MSGPRCDDSQPTALPESSTDPDPDSVPPTAAALGGRRCDPPQTSTVLSLVEPKLPTGALSTPAALAPLWSRVIRSASASPVMRAILMNSTLASVENGVATIIAPPRYASGAPKFLAQISDLLTREHGSPLQALVRSADTSEPIDAAPTDTAPTDIAHDPIAQQPPAPRPTPSNLPNAANHPLVKQALELFGGRIVDVQPRKPT